MSLDVPFVARVLRATGVVPRRALPLGGGCVAEILRLDLEDGRVLVAKKGVPGDRLDLEGFMLRHLAEAGVPTPEVLLAEDDLLLMAHVEGDDTLDGSAQVHLADMLATLHAVPRESFGFDRDTVVGGLRQPNPARDRWIPFLAEHRFIHMARQAMTAGRLSPALVGRVETLAGRLGRWLREPDHPSLLHGDLWGGNILCREGRVVALIDPALYHGDPEIELALGTLFGTLGTPFFDRYREHRPLEPGFFEERRDLYNLYPLLVHVRLFGGHYVQSVERTLARFGV
ncbi:MAG: fructosamine kinase family protein [Rhodospirillum sp.]|nr:fructosamine kinase family protein [Rhodospirillum sp.]MCF8487863.1 fructosamine kinase family protein [Rhodospirillum sp.]MCF8499185.1 fructosamine kinase family protein [Rhodospirillum sp.]